MEASFAVPAFFIVCCAFLYLFEAIQLQGAYQRELADAAKEYAAYGVKRTLISAVQGENCPVQWDIDSEGGICSCTVKKAVPALPKQLLSLCLYHQMTLHTYAGKTMTPQQTSAENCYVYVAEQGVVYHRDIGCTYLRLGIQEVAASQIETLRNQSGGKYKPCEFCMEGKEQKGGQTVYITPYGARYHSISDCSRLRRTIRKVKLSEVGHLPPCSKCGGR